MSFSTEITKVLENAQSSLCQASTPTRQIANGGGPELLSAILAEIDQTMLPRSLRFECGDNQHLIFDVGERRVLLVAAVQPQALWDTLMPLVSGRNQEMSVGEINAICSLLSRFTRTGGNLSVTSGPASRQYGLDAEGYSVAELAKSINLPVPEGSGADEPTPDAVAMKPPAPEPDEVAPVAARPETPAASPDEVPEASGLEEYSTTLRAFYEASEIFARGRVVIDLSDEVKASAGEDPQVQLPELARIVARQLRRTNPLLDMVIPARRLVLLSTQIAGAPSVCALADPREVLVATFNETDLGKVFAAWHSLASTAE